MNPGFIIPILFITIIFSAWAIGTYNKFIKYNNRIEEALNRIDVALKRRANLIPNLVRVVKGYSAHEGKIYGDKTEQLGMLSQPERLEQERQISKNLRGLLAVAEAYPDLKASANFLDLQNNLDEIEQDVQRARNYHNDYIARLNTAVESFPASFIARKYHFEKQDYLALELATERGMPDISFSQGQDKEDKKA